MQGAIAAGSRHTAEAGALVLEEGGNAVDACVAAAFAAAVAEGPLIGPAGGGFFLGWVDGEVTLLDCFFAAPTSALGEIEDITVDFGDSTQSYHVGDEPIEDAVNKLRLVKPDSEEVLAARAIGISFGDR